MNTNETILGSIEPEIAERLATSANEIAQGRTTSSHRRRRPGHGVGADRARRAVARRVRADVDRVTDVLNFALEARDLRERVLQGGARHSSSAAQNTAFATVRAKVPAAALPAFQQIQKHEAAHVAFLTGDRRDERSQPHRRQLRLHRRARRGQRSVRCRRRRTCSTCCSSRRRPKTRACARTRDRRRTSMSGNLTVLEAALRIHSVEARHAAKIRRLRRQNGAPTA